MQREAERQSSARAGRYHRSIFICHSSRCNSPSRPRSQLKPLSRGGVPGWNEIVTAHCRGLSRVCDLVETAKQHGRGVRSLRECALLFESLLRLAGSTSAGNVLRTSCVEVFAVAKRILDSPKLLEEVGEIALNTLTGALLPVPAYVSSVGPGPWPALLRRLLRMAFSTPSSAGPRRHILLAAATQLVHAVEGRGTADSSTGSVFPMPAHAARTASGSPSDQPHPGAVRDLAPPHLSLTHTLQMAAAWLSSAADAFAEGPHALPQRGGTDTLLALQEVLRLLTAFLARRQSGAYPALVLKGTPVLRCFTRKGLIQPLLRDVAGQTAFLSFVAAWVHCSTQHAALHGERHGGEPKITLHPLAAHDPMAAEAFVLSQQVLLHSDVMLRALGTSKASQWTSGATLSGPECVVHLHGLVNSLPLAPLSDIAYLAHLYHSRSLESFAERAALHVSSRRTESTRKRRRGATGQEGSHLSKPDASPWILPRLPEQTVSVSPWEAQLQHTLRHVRGQGQSAETLKGPVSPRTSSLLCPRNQTIPGSEVLLFTAACLLRHPDLQVPEGVEERLLQGSSDVLRNVRAVRASHLHALVELLAALQYHHLRKSTLLSSGRSSAQMTSRWDGLHGLVETTLLPFCFSNTSQFGQATFELALQLHLAWVGSSAGHMQLGRLLSMPAARIDLGSSGCFHALLQGIQGAIQTIALHQHRVGVPLGAQALLQQAECMASAHPSALFTAAETVQGYIPPAREETLSDQPMDMVVAVWAQARYLAAIEQATGADDGALRVSACTALAVQVVLDCMAPYLSQRSGQSGVSHVLDQLRLSAASQVTGKAFPADKPRDVGICSPTPDVWSPTVVQQRLATLHSPIDLEKELFSHSQPPLIARPTSPSGCTKPTSPAFRTRLAMAQHSPLSTALPKMWAPLSPFLQLPLGGAHQPLEAESGGMSEATFPLTEGNGALKHACAAVCTIQTAISTVVGPIQAAGSVVQLRDFLMLCSLTESSARLLPAIFSLSAPSTPIQLSPNRATLNLHAWGVQRLAIAAFSKLCLLIAASAGPLLLQSQSEGTEETMRRRSLEHVRCAVWSMHVWLGWDLLQAGGAAAHALGSLGAGLPGRVAEDTLAIVRAVTLATLTPLQPRFLAVNVDQHAHEQYLQEHLADFPALAPLVPQASSSLGSASASKTEKATLPSPTLDDDDDIFLEKAVAGIRVAADSSSLPASSQSEVGPPLAVSKCDSGEVSLVCDILCLSHTLFLDRGGAVDPALSRCIDVRWTALLASAMRAWAGVEGLGLCPELRCSMYTAERTSSARRFSVLRSMADTALDIAGVCRVLHPADAAAICLSVHSASCARQVLQEQWFRRAAAFSAMACVTLCSLHGLVCSRPSLVTAALICAASTRSGMSSSQVQRCASAPFMAHVSGFSTAFQELCSRFDSRDVAPRPVGGGSLEHACSWFLSATELGDKAVGFASSEHDAVIHMTSSAGIHHREDYAASAAVCAEALVGLACGHQAQWLCSWRAVVALCQVEHRTASSVRADKAYVHCNRLDSWQASSAAFHARTHPALREARSIRAAPAAFSSFLEARCTSTGWASLLPPVSVHVTGIAADVAAFMMGVSEVMYTCVLCHSAATGCELETYLLAQSRALWASCEHALCENWKDLGLQRQQPHPLTAVQYSPVSERKLPKWVLSGASEALPQPWAAEVDVGEGPEPLWGFCGLANDGMEPGGVCTENEGVSATAHALSLLLRRQAFGFEMGPFTRAACLHLHRNICLCLPRMAPGARDWDLLVSQAFPVARRWALSPTSGPLQSAPSVPGVEQEAEWFVHFAAQGLHTPCLLTKQSAGIALWAARSLASCAVLGGHKHNLAQAAASTLVLPDPIPWHSSPEPSMPGAVLSHQLVDFASQVHGDPARILQALSSLCTTPTPLLEEDTDSALVKTSGGFRGNTAHSVWNCALAAAALAEGNEGSAHDSGRADLALTPEHPIETHAGVWADGYQYSTVSTSAFAFSLGGQAVSNVGVLTEEFKALMVRVTSPHAGAFLLKCLAFFCERNGCDSVSSTLMFCLPDLTAAFCASGWGATCIPPSLIGASTWQELSGVLGCSWLTASALDGAQAGSDEVAKAPVPVFQRPLPAFTPRPAETAQKQYVDRAEAFAACWRLLKCTPESGLAPDPSAAAWGAWAVKASPTRRAPTHSLAQLLEGWSTLLGMAPEPWIPRHSTTQGLSSGTAGHGAHAAVDPQTRLTTAPQPAPVVGSENMALALGHEIGLVVLLLRSTGSDAAEKLASHLFGMLEPARRELVLKEVAQVLLGDAQVDAGTSPSALPAIVRATQHLRCLEPVTALDVQPLQVLGIAAELTLGRYSVDCLDSHSLRTRVAGVFRALGPAALLQLCFSVGSASPTSTCARELLFFVADLCESGHLRLQDVVPVLSEVRGRSQPVSSAGSALHVPQLYYREASHALYRGMGELCAVLDEQGQEQVTLNSAVETVQAVMRCVKASRAWLSICASDVSTALVRAEAGTEGAAIALHAAAALAMEGPLIVARCCELTARSTAQLGELHEELGDSLEGDPMKQVLPGAQCSEVDLCRLRSEAWEALTHVLRGFGTPIPVAEGQDARAHPHGHVDSGSWGKVLTAWQKRKAAQPPPSCVAAAIQGLHRASLASLAHCCPELLPEHHGSGPFRGSLSSLIALQECAAEAGLQDRLQSAQRQAARNVATWKGTGRSARGLPGMLDARHGHLLPHRQVHSSRIVAALYAAIAAECEAALLTALTSQRDSDHHGRCVCRRSSLALAEAELSLATMMDSLTQGEFLSSPRLASELLGAQVIRTICPDGLPLQCAGLWMHLGEIQDASCCSPYDGLWGRVQQRWMAQVRPQATSEFLPCGSKPLFAEPLLAPAVAETHRGTDATTLPAYGDANWAKLSGHPSLTGAVWASSKWPCALTALCQDFIPQSPEAALLGGHELSEPRNQLRLCIAALPACLCTLLHHASVLCCKLSARGPERDARKRQRGESVTLQDGFVSSLTLLPGMGAEIGLHQLGLACRQPAPASMGSTEIPTPAELVAAPPPPASSLHSRSDRLAVVAIAPPCSNALRDALSKCVGDLLQEAMRTRAQDIIYAVLAAVDSLRAMRQVVVSDKLAQDRTWLSRHLKGIGVPSVLQYGQQLSLDISRRALFEAAMAVNDTSRASFYCDLLLRDGAAWAASGAAGLPLHHHILQCIGRFPSEQQQAVRRVMAAQWSTPDGGAAFAAETPRHNLEQWHEDAQPSGREGRCLWQLEAAALEVLDVGTPPLAQLELLKREAAMPAVSELIKHSQALAPFAATHGTLSDTAAIPALMAVMEQSLAWMRGCSEGSLQAGDEVQLETCVASACAAHAMCTFGLRAPQAAVGIELGPDLLDLLHGGLRWLAMEQSTPDSSGFSSVLSAWTSSVPEAGPTWPGVCATFALQTIMAAQALPSSTHPWVARALSRVRTSGHFIVGEYTDGVRAAIQRYHQSEPGRQQAAIAEQRAQSFSAEKLRRAMRAYKQGMSSAAFREALQLPCDVEPAQYVSSLCKLQKRVDQDKATKAARQATHSLCLTSAIFHFARGLEHSAGSAAVPFSTRLSMALRMVGLWMDHFSKPEAFKVLEGVLPKVPSQDLLPVLSQLVSQLGRDLKGRPVGDGDGDSYTRMVEGLVVRLAQHSPYEVIPSLMLLFQGDVGSGPGVGPATGTPAAKQLAAGRVFARLKTTSAGLADVCSVLCEAIDGYTALALKDHTKRGPTALRGNMDPQPTSTVSLLSLRRMTLEHVFKPERFSPRLRLPRLRLLPLLTHTAASRGQLPGQCAAVSTVPGDGLGEAVAATEGGQSFTADGVRLPEVHVVRISGQYELMGNGITKPKRLRHFASDGSSHSSIFKGPNDDMRQDALMTQLFCVMNALLAGSGSPTAQRNLHIRTYTVRPLARTCGMLEFVPGTIAFGESVSAFHMRFGVQGEVTLDQARRQLQHAAQQDAASERHGESPHSSTLPQHAYSNRLAAFSSICERLLPRFHLWLSHNFPDPRAWWAATRQYTASVATNSIIGYIAGVGDRHCHNILVDCSTAEMVHIDFGVLFDAGKLLRTPETVPFRLTREVVAGLGAAGVEGGLRQACEMSLQVAREHTVALKTLVTVMVHDPLFEWTIAGQEDDSEAAGSTRSALREVEGFVQTEVLNPDAMDVVARIDEKLRGMDADVLAPVVAQTASSSSSATSVPHHVQQLLAAARDPHRLCRIFNGWKPFL